MASHSVSSRNVESICDRMGLDLSLLGTDAAEALRNGITYHVGIWVESDAVLGVVEIEPGLPAFVTAGSIDEALEYAAESVLDILVLNGEKGSLFKQPTAAVLDSPKLHRKADHVKALAISYPSSGGSSVRESADGKQVYPYGLQSSAHYAPRS